MFLTGKWKRLLKQIAATCFCLMILIVMAVFVWFDELLEAGRQQLVKKGIHISLPTRVEATGRSLKIRGLSLDPGLHVEDIFLEWGSVTRHDLRDKLFQHVSIDGLRLSVEQGDDMAWRIPGLNIEHASSQDFSATSPFFNKLAAGFYTPLQSLPEIVIIRSTILLECQALTSHITIDELKIRPEGQGVAVSFVGKLKANLPDTVNFDTGIKGDAWLNLNTKEVDEFNITLSDLFLKRAHEAEIQIPQLEAVVRGVNFNGLSGAVEAGQLRVVADKVSMHGEPFEGHLSETGMNLLLETIQIPWLYSSLDQFISHVTMGKGIATISGVYQHQQSHPVKIHTQASWQEVSLLHNRGSYQLFSQLLIQDRILHGPYSVTLASSGDIADTGSELEVQLAGRSGNVDRQLAKIDVTMPSIPLLIDAFQGNISSPVIINTSAVFDIPSAGFLPHTEAGQYLSPPLHVSLKNRGQFTFSKPDLRVMSLTNARVEMAGCTMQLSLQSDFQGNLLKGEVTLHSQDTVNPVDISCFTEIPGKVSVSGRFGFMQRDEHPLASVEWENDDVTIEYFLQTTTEEPIVIKSSGADKGQMVASGSVFVNGTAVGSEVGVVADTDLAFNMMNQSTDMNVSVSGDLFAIFSQDREEITMGTGNGLSLFVDGYVPEVRLTRSAQFQVHNGTGAWLLNIQQGEPHLNALIQSDGPRLDGTLAGTRAVVKQEGLTIHLRKKPGDLFDVDLNISELLIPKHEIIFENITSSLQFDPVVLCPEGGWLDIDSIKDVALTRRFPDMSLTSQAESLFGRIKGQSDVVTLSGAGTPLQLHIGIDASCDGSEGKILLTAGNYKLSPEEINIKSLFPQSSRWIESLSGQFDFTSSVVWDTSTNGLVSDSSARLSSFEIDMASAFFFDQGISLVGGEVLVFSHIPLDSPETGSITTHLDGITIGSPQFSLSGLQGLDIFIEPIMPAYTVQPVTITFDELNSFLPFGHGTVRVSVNEGRQLAINELQMELGNGLVTVQPSNIDLGADYNEVYLEAKDVDLSALRNQLQISLKENLDVNGLVDGFLPIRFSENSIKLIDATFTSTASGFIRYNPGKTEEKHVSLGNIYYQTSLSETDQDSSPAAGNTSFTETLAMNTFQKAVSNLHYDSFTAVLNGDLGRALTIDLEALGANPDMLFGIPVDLHLEIETELSKLFSAYNSSIGSTERSYHIAD